MSSGNLGAVCLLFDAVRQLTSSSICRESFLTMGLHQTTILPSVIYFVLCFFVCFQRGKHLSVVKHLPTICGEYFANQFPFVGFSHDMSDITGVKLDFLSLSSRTQKSSCTGCVTFQWFLLKGSLWCCILLSCQTQASGCDNGFIHIASKQSLPCMPA